MTSSEFHPELNNEYGEAVQLINEYNEYLINLKVNGKSWVDNGLRVCSKMVGIPRTFKEKGLALENELGRILDENVKPPSYYKLQCPFGRYQRADALVTLNNTIFIRIEAKYVNEKNATSNWKYKNFLEWSTKYRQKPRFFYP